METTAAEVIAASETPVTTYSGQTAIGTDLWTAVVTIGGHRYEYVFRGDHHNSSAQPVGHIRRRYDTNTFIVCAAEGGVQVVAGREAAIRSLA